jgi:hypothetical protein
MKKLATYKNGNSQVTIYEDGTKVRRYSEPLLLEFPESMDIKITNYCDLGCKFCHEMSDTVGKHADLDKLLTVLQELPPGVELAIGGGNPLSHPDIFDFLRKLRQMGFIPNMTVNQRHLKRHLSDIKKMLREELIFGLGISINNTELNEVKELMKITKNIVFHLIAGVNSVKEIEWLRKLDYCKILVLGYKQIGRGADYFSTEVKQNMMFWNAFVGMYLSEGALSFDNLAIEQLYIKQMMTEEEWDRYYMGDDFTFSMYIDAVNQQFAPSSTSRERESFDKYSLIEYFQKFRNR